MYEYKVILRKVHDADSAIIDIDFGFNLWRMNVGFRLFGYQAPEVRTSNVREKYLGELASNIIKEHFVCGEEYKFISKKDKTGKYGRVLGDICTLTAPEISWRALLSSSKLCVSYGYEDERDYWDALYDKIRDQL